MFSPKRDVQTKIKHDILEQYLKAWTGIILHGIKNLKNVRGTPKVKFVYVDLFSCSGTYDFDTTQSVKSIESPIKGSPLIGIDCLRKAVRFGNDYKIDVSYNCIFIENDVTNFNNLYDVLNTGNYLGRGRILKTDNFSELKDQDVAIIHDDCLKHKDNILSYINSQQTWSFIFIDPYGSKSIPMSMVSDYANANKVDCVVNFPILDVYRKAGNIDNIKSIIRNSGQEQTLKNIDDTYGNSNWREVKNLMRLPNIENKTKKIEDFLGEHYYISLGLKCPNVCIKRIPINFPDKTRIMFDLLLTTKDPNGALVMNNILRKAEVSQEYHAKIAKIRNAEKKVIESNQISVFSPEEVLKDTKELTKPKPITYHKHLVGGVLNRELKKLDKHQILLHDILRICANLPFNRSEVLNGLKYLKSIKIVNYNRLEKGHNLVDILV